MNIDPRIRDVLGRPGAVLLEAFGDYDNKQSILFSDAVHTVEAHRPEDVVPALHRLDALLDEGFSIAGFMAYEAGYAFEPQRFESEIVRDWASELGYPLLWFGAYRGHERISIPPPSSVDCSELRLEDTGAPGSYQDAVRSIRHLIEEGDVYQINYTTRFEGKPVVDPVQLYQAVRDRQQVEYGAFVSLKDHAFLSFSPELFFETKGGAIGARPMKGTAPRGESSLEDNRLRHWLQTDVKSQAENLMIVDLLRNDLSEVCLTGSVEVPQLFLVQELSTVLQMTSQVRGQMKDEIQLSDVFKALFPCGSITGAPKIRAMRRIAELEDSPRGIYCGTIGYAKRNTVSGELDSGFSVAIRTLSCSSEGVRYGTGGGIVWDSDPDAEYDEAVLKTAFFRETQEPVLLIETMLFDSQSGIRLLDYHLDRLEQSASDLGYRFDRSSAELTIKAFCRSLEACPAHRIRMTISHDGTTDLTSRPADRPVNPVRIGPAGIRVSSGDPLLRHKTTRRGVYGRAQDVAREHDWFDAILQNERGELTEGAITNLFIKLDGQWVTPPLESGLLPGVSRRDFLLNSGAVQKPVTLQDVRRADSICLTNAVIGVQSAIWSEDEERPV